MKVKIKTEQNKITSVESPMIWNRKYSTSYEYKTVVSIKTERLHFMEISTDINHTYWSVRLRHILQSMRGNFTNNTFLTVVHQSIKTIFNVTYRLYPSLYQTPKINCFHLTFPVYMFMFTFLEILRYMYHDPKYWARVIALQ